MAALRRPAIRQSLHESAQRSEVQRAVLHLVIDVIGPRLGHLLAFFITAMPARVINRLALLQKLNRAIQPLGLIGGRLRGQIKCARGNSQESNESPLGSHGNASYRTGTSEARSD